MTTEARRRIAAELLTWAAGGGLPSGFALLIYRISMTDAECYGASERVAVLHTVLVAEAIKQGCWP